MRLCYWDFSVSYSFVMSFVNHSWPAVYRMELRLSFFFLPLTLVIFFSHKELLFYSPKDWLLAQIRESETLIQNSQAFLYLQPATPSTFPPGNYIRIVYTRNCPSDYYETSFFHDKNELKSWGFFFSPFWKWSAPCTGWERRRLNPTCFHPWTLSSLFQTQEMITTAISCHT